MFADSDFILALVKEKDCLKNKANKVFEEYKEKIKTSASVMIEIALLCKKFNREVFRTFSDISGMIKIEEEVYNLCLRAATYIDENNLRAYPQRLIGPRVIEEKLNEVYPIRIGS